MGMLLYLPEKSGSSLALLGMIKYAICDHEIEIFSTVSGLSERLHRPMLDIGVAVLYASQRSELMEIIYLSDLLKELNVVLVVPDSQSDTLDKAYALRPRFIAVAESDFKHLGVILNKMMDLYSKTH